MDLQENSLKHVFEALDTADQGYISVEQFISSFQNFENSKELSDSFDAENFKRISSQSSKLQLWIDTLDPQNNGKIYFSDFVAGIRRLNECPEESYDNLSVSVPRSESRPLHFLTEEDSFSQDQLLTPVVVVANDDSGIQISNGGESFNPFDFGCHNTATENRFPNVFSPLDNDVLSPQSINNDNDGRGRLSPARARHATKLYSDPNAQSTDGGIVPSENNTLTRGGEIRSTWPKRQRQSMALCTPQMSAQMSARALSSRGNSNRGSLSSLNGSHSDIYDDLDNNFDIMQDQYKRLEKKMEELISNQSDGAGRESRLREDNQALINRLNVLEDFLRDSHDSSIQSVQQEKRQLQDKLNRIDRDNQEEISRLNQKQILLETEICTSQAEAAKLKAESEKCKLELVRAQDRLSSTQSQLSSTQEDIEHLRDVHQKELGILSIERDRANELLDSLSHEVSELRPPSSAPDDLPPSSSSSSTGLSLAGRCHEAEDLVGRITRENKALREQLEEAQAELFTRSIEEGRSLVRKTDVSLASEIDTYTKDQVMDLLVKEKEANFKLREYIESIIIRIMDRHPSLLEIG